MRSSGKDAALAVVLLATATCAALAWLQTRRIHSLEQEAQRELAERGTLQDQLKDARQKHELLQAEVAALREATRNTVATAPAVQVAGPAAGPVRREFNPARDPAARSMAGMMNRPEFQQAMMAGIRSGLDQRYATLFRQLQLPPAELAKLKNLLADRQAAAMDVMTAARTAGGPPPTPEELRALMASANSEVDASIHELLGDARYAQYEEFDRHAAHYSTAEQLERRLSYTQTPLQPAQLEELVRIFANTAPPEAPPESRNAMVFTAAASSAFGGGPMASVMLGGGAPSITDAAIDLAQGVLDENQLNALRELQAEQQAMARLAPGRGMIFRSGGGGGGGSFNVSPPAP